VGRPIQKPKIKPRPLKGGGFSYLVTATVGGRQFKKVSQTLDVAKELVAKLRGAWNTIYK
jgi:hypothetical protein